MGTSLTNSEKNEVRIEIGAVPQVRLSGALFGATNLDAITYNSNQLFSYNEVTNTWSGGPTWSITVASVTTTGQFTLTLVSSKWQLNGPDGYQVQSETPGSVFGPWVDSLGSGNPYMPTFRPAFLGSQGIVTFEDSVYTAIKTPASLASFLGLSSYANLTAANAALTIGTIYYDTTLLRINITTA